MYDNLYKYPVNVINIYDYRVEKIQINICSLDKIQICDINKQYNSLNLKNYCVIHINNLVRETYIESSDMSVQNSKSFFSGYINESLIEEI